MKYMYLLLLFLLLACRQGVDTKVDKAVQRVLTEVSETPEIKTPEELLGELFKAVQLKPVFEDSKTFADCTARYPYDSILANYEIQNARADFDLETFVYEHFETPPDLSSNFSSDSELNAIEHVKSLWPVLKRESDKEGELNSLIPLPEPYIVPGGRFREVYYWDSFFTMLGLVQSGDLETVKHMLDNFAYLIKVIGHIPNGNRSYYITRSQPPFFSEMVNLLARHEGDGILDGYKEELRREYEFWMAGSEVAEEALDHCVPTQAGVMNRYFDQGDSPRQESYREDFNLVESSRKDAEKMYRDLRSGAESGWDFSSRWFADASSLASIQTTDIIPIDLNALLYGLESTLLGLYDDDEAFVARIRQSMENRVDFMNQFAWNSRTGVFEDYNWKTQKRTGVKSLAMVFPLYFGMANQEQADRVADYLSRHFLKPGGLVTTLNHTGQQWDAPNGWAPLQWMAIRGLEKYGHSDLAVEIARRWVNLNEKVYQETGKFVEKYNVEDISLKAGGGEYPVQDGFGWSNGVYLDLKSYLSRDGIQNQ